MGKVSFCVRQRIIFALLVPLVAGLAGCASVKVHKLNRDGSINTAAAEGLRFYLPRPYVSVYEPFVVATEVHLARGELSPDSQHVLLTDVPDALRGIVAPALANNGRGGMGDLRVEASQVRVTGGGPQSVPADGKPDEPAADATPAAGENEEGSATDATTGPSGGVLNLKARNDNNAYAVTPQPRYFNIVWLPDFDEHYVVSAKAGLGNAGVDLGFGQGWNLQAIEATTDNSAVVKPLLDFYGATIGALEKVATAKIEGPLAVLTGGGPQSAGARATSFSGGTPVAVKVTKARVVAPGLYPILKPAEIESLPVLDEAQQRRILAPKPPLTNIAFNTYDVIVIEAAKASGDSALQMQQYAGGGGGGAVTTSSPASPSTPTSAVSTDVLSKLRVKLSDAENRTKSGEYYVPAVTSDPNGGGVIVTLTKQTGGGEGTRTALPDRAELESIVKSVLAGVVVARTDIK